MARKVKHPEHVNHERWLVSYADFITLLFATFTMLFAISNVEKAKMAAAAQSLNKAFGGASSASHVYTLPSVLTTGQPATGTAFVIKIMPANPKSGGGAKGDDDTDETGSGTAGTSDAGKGEGKGAGAGGDKGNGDGKGEGIGNGNGEGKGRGANSDPNSAQSSETPAGGKPEQLGTAEGGGDSQMAAKIQSLVETLGLKGKIDVREEKRGTVISLGETAFFNRGEVEVKETSKFQLDKVVNALRDQHFNIRVEGHTDNTPVTSGRFRSNLELSTVRAAHIVDFMIKEYHYPPELVSCAGYGEQKPIADNNTEEGRQKNRRVDIVILNQDMRALEPKATK